MLEIVCNAIFVFLSIYSIYYMVMALGAVIPRRKKIPSHMPKNKLCVVIAARNEEAVIGQLVESLLNQEYPDELYDIWVVPNNCTDDTENTARNAGARILRCGIPIKTKGQVLQYAFKELSADDTYDAYLVFDADNVVQHDFLSRMNDALCEGYHVVQGYRDSKNPLDTWVSGSSSFLYVMTNLFLNRSRMNIGSSAYLNGTGLMISDAHYKKYGFDTYSLTEDIEYTVQCATHGVRVAFVEDAVTYDEQVTDFSASVRQRRRWSTGTYQCLRLYFVPLIKGILQGRFACFDMLMYLLSPVFQILTAFIWIPLSLSMLSGPKWGDEVLDVLFYVTMSAVYTYGISVAVELLAVKFAGRYINEARYGILTFPLYILTWLPINVLCLIRKDTVWLPIRHTRNMRISQLKMEALELRDIKEKA